MGRHISTDVTDDAGVDTERPDSGDCSEKVAQQIALVASMLRTIYPHLDHEDVLAQATMSVQEMAAARGAGSAAWQAKAHEVVGAIRASFADVPDATLARQIRRAVRQAREEIRKEQEAEGKQ